MVPISIFTRVGIFNKRVYFCKKKMNQLTDLNFNGKKALIRADLNVPIKEGRIGDNSRIMGSLPTIHHILDQGGAVILMSHLGRPEKDKTEDGKIKRDKYSLKPVVDELAKLTGKKVSLSTDTGGQDSKSLSNSLKAGEILVLENTRFESGEGKGDPELAENLASLADYYINDAFGTAHRAHASTTTVAKFFDEDKKAIGMLMGKELKEAKNVTDSPKRPYTVILGGAKVSDKLLLIKNLIAKADHLLIGGGMAYTFIKAKGGKIGKSLCEDDRLELVIEIMAEAEKNKCTIHLPVDTIAADAFSEAANTSKVKTSEIPDDLMGLDIGPETIKRYSKIILESSTLFWNGPMGVFEIKPFSKGTIEVAKAIAKATAQGAYSLIGGGDSVSAVNKFGMGDQMSYLSTGGGAMLTLLEGSPLPAIDAIME